MRPSILLAVPRSLRLESLIPVGSSDALVAVEARLRKLWNAEDPATLTRLKNRGMTGAQEVAIAMLISTTLLRVSVIEMLVFFLMAAGPDSRHLSAQGGGPEGLAGMKCYGEDDEPGDGYQQRARGYAEDDEDALIFPSLDLEAEDSVDG